MPANLGEMIPEEYLVQVEQLYELGHVNLEKYFVDGAKIEDKPTVTSLYGKRAPKNTRLTCRRKSENCWKRSKKSRQKRMLFTETRLSGSRRREKP